MTDPDARSLSAEDRDRLTRTIASMLWAAWADAVGFISELVDQGGLKRRLRGGALEMPVEWTRRVGGRFGATAVLPAGTYSDDTQLRLAASRSISARTFDVASFAKVEMTVWPAYALGGGRASKAAAQSLTRPTTSWSTNFYDGWHNAGGNGAAMRIQPHVWAASDLEGSEFILDVVRNTVVTHGHPRAIVGAVLHAVALAHSLRTGRVMSQSDWPQLLERTRSGIAVFDQDRQLSTYWRPQWESQTGARLDHAWNATVEEARLQLELAAAVLKSADSADFSTALAVALGLRDPSQVGSGLLTSVAAIATAAAFPLSARDAGLNPARQLGTDTDTIATMAAAIVGAATGERAPGEIQDRRYMRDEADRLFRIATQKPAPGFPYPDPLHWKPPRTQLDVVGTVDGVLTIAGLGPISRVGATFTAKEAEWAWVDTKFGPTMLVKRRFESQQLSPGSRPRLGVSAAADQTAAPTPVLLGGLELEGAVSETKPTTKSAPRSKPMPRSRIDDLLAGLAAAEFEDGEIGRAVREVAQQGTPEQLVNFVKKLRVLIP